MKKFLVFSIILLSSFTIIRKHTIYFIGDSLTVGYIKPYQSFTPSNYVIANKDKVNLGIAGLKMTELDSIIGPKLYKTRKKEIMIIQIGTNDIGSGGLPQIEFNSLETFCKKYKKKGLIILAATLPSVIIQYGGQERFI